MTTERLPQVGDRVFYFAYGTPGGEFPVGVPRAAVVTEVRDGLPLLCIFNPGGLFFSAPLQKRNPKLTSGCWDWDTSQPRNIGPFPATAAGAELPHLCANCWAEIHANDVFYTTTDGEMICAACRARGGA